MRLTTSKVLGNCQTQSTIRSTKTKSMISLGVSFVEFGYLREGSVPHLLPLLALQCTIVDGSMQRTTSLKPFC